jgi:chemotaxis-related protein WspB
MLVLTFEAAGQRLALDTRRVVEVLPWVQVQPVARAPAWVAGFFSYRGTVAAVLDIGQLAGGEPCACRYNSRLIVVSIPGAGGSRRVGLLAERVGTAQVSAPAERGPGDAEAAAWGTLLLDERGVFQLLDVARLIPAGERGALAALPSGVAP